MTRPEVTSRPERTAAAPRLVVTDLDGTLLDRTGNQVSARNLAALNRAAAAGARVVIATGRPIWWLGPVIAAGFDGIAVCMNGAVVYDVGARQVVSVRPMTSQSMQQFVTQLSALTRQFHVAVERVGTTVAQAWSEPDYVHPWGLGEFRIAGRAQLLAEPAAKLLIRGSAPSGTLAAAATEAGAAWPGPEQSDPAGAGTAPDPTGDHPDRVSVTYSSDDGLVEVAAAGVNKGTALDRLAREWNISAAEAIAFGDMPNDLEMLSWAGRGVAMGNAHPDVLAVADETAPHHQADGVAEVLERWF